jgi:hypothetical protein
MRYCEKKDEVRIMRQETEKGEGKGGGGGGVGDSVS